MSLPNRPSLEKREEVEDEGSVCFRVRAPLGENTTLIYPSIPSHTQWQVRYLGDRELELETRFQSSKLFNYRLADLLWDHQPKRSWEVKIKENGRVAVFRSTEAKILPKVYRYLGLPLATAFLCLGRPLYAFSYLPIGEKLAVYHLPTCGKEAKPALVVGERELGMDLGPYRVHPVLAWEFPERPLDGGLVLLDGAPNPPTYAGATSLTLIPNTQVKWLLAKVHTS